MTKHFQRDLEELKKAILAEGRLVEDAFQQATRAVIKRDRELAKKVLVGDERIDESEVEIESDCLKVLALHQPVAADLRFIIAVMKVNNDLERIGDLAVDIAERAAFLSKREPLDAPVDFEGMVTAVRGQVRRSLDALVRQDAVLAREVCRCDDEIDERNREMYDILQQLMRTDPETVERAVHTLSVSRHLERIGDLATNIAEDVVFMVEGEIIRHHRWEE
ncbi:MAG: phosphate transport system regulatory protein PhoU [Candidatus Hydrogenedentota bacterium]|nr:MAG: phosphate transport system regulatory protein PhoU [Candidatus Hydrogenedentota bacterium]